MAKRKTRKKGKNIAQSTADLRRNGLKAFQSGNYDRAIEYWEKAGKQMPDRRPVSALAEAHFRRGLKTPAEVYENLKQAVDLKPDDPIYSYHLGLTAHRQGKLSEAVDAYRQARQGDEKIARRAAYPLALALRQQGEGVTETAVWQALSPDEQKLLQNTAQFDRRPYEVADDAAALWQGLAAYDDGRLDDARQQLTAALEEPNTAGIAHNYLGAIAAQEEKWTDAAHHWTAARAADFFSPALINNIGELYHRLAEERLENGNVDGGMTAAEEAYRYKEDNALLELMSHGFQNRAYQAAVAGKFEEAMDHWDTAETRGGGTFRIAYNMALALEKMELFYDAAERWREALRRKPRRDDHPDAIDDEQVARLWQRTAEAYSKAEEFDEAVQVQRHAVKWQPDNVAIRQNLAEGLLNNGQLQAAENELERILERDSEYVPALLLMGELLSQYRYYYADEGPVPYWEKVLEIEPDNEAARHYLADHYQEMANEWIDWQGNFRKALDILQKALNYLPESGQILMAIGRCHLMLEEEEEARTYFDRAVDLNSGDFRVYVDQLESWLSVDRPEEARNVVAQAEAGIVDLPYVFYIIGGERCIVHEQQELAKEWFERAIEKAPPGEPVLLTIGNQLVTVPGSADIARAYLERAIAQNQEPGNAHFLLGVLAARDGDMKEMEKQWRQAERLARKHNQPDLLDRVVEARAIFTGPMGFLARSVLSGGMMGGVPLMNLIEEFGGDFDDWDDEFWDIDDNEFF